MRKTNCFRYFRDLDEGHEDELTRALLVLLRLSPAAHSAFLDLVRESQPVGSRPLPSSSDLLSSGVRIDTQETRIDIDTGILFSIVLTRAPWSPSSSVESTSATRRYDGVLYYGDVVIILENKPREEIPPSDVLELEKNPNLADGLEIEVEPRAVNVLWRNVLSRLNRLSAANLIHGAEDQLLNDFLAYIDRNFPYLNPFSSIGACRGSVPSLHQRCREVLEQISSGEVGREGVRSHFISLSESVVGRVFLAPDPADPAVAEPATGIHLRLHPGLTVPQARKFYSSVGKNSFLRMRNPSSGWVLKPTLAFRVFTSSPMDVDVRAKAEDYMEFWAENQDLIRGRISKEVIEGPYCERMVTKQGIVDADTFTRSLATISDKQKVDICPGWRLEYSWSIEAASGLDSRGEFANAVRQRVHEAFAAMGQPCPVPCPQCANRAA